MKAAICTKYGPPEVIQIQDIPRPEVKPNDVLIKVKATSVNSGDVRIRGLRVDDGPLGSMTSVVMRVVMGFKGPRNKVLGGVVSGVVEEIGSAVTTLRVGDEVYAMTGLRMGGYAEFAAVNHKKAIALKPEEASFEEAAALPFGGTTAIYFLRKAHIKKAQKVLIYGASGAVGTAAIQVAKHHGADVTAISGPDGIELSKQLGATQTYDYTMQQLSNLKGSYDIIFDAVGKISKQQSQHLLSTTGIFVTVGGMDVAKELSTDLEQLAEMHDEGSLTAVIDKTYALDEIVAAHRYVDTGRKKGNVVITVS